jgi:hypothetical protein
MCYPGGKTPGGRRVFDFSDHALTQIGTWTEVAILLFMVWEHYGPHIWSTTLTAATDRQSLGLGATLWDNRTLIVAIVGIVIVGWLHFGLYQGAQAQKATLIDWLQKAQQERNAARQDASAAQRQLVAIQQNMAAVQNQGQTRPAALDETARMPAGDKDRLADALYEFSQLFDQGDTLRSRCNHLNIDGRGSIVEFAYSDLPGFLNTSDNLIASSKEFTAHMNRLRDKWKYYATQINYILGNDPDNHALIAQNAITEARNFVELWGKAGNSNKTEIRELLNYPQTDFMLSMIKFGKWLSECEDRLLTIKGTIR